MRQLTAGRMGWSGLCNLISPFVEGAESLKFMSFHLELGRMRLGVWFVVFLTWFWSYVEIRCQLDATDYIYCMLNMFRAILCPSSGARDVLYRLSLPVVFGALVFRLSVWCGAEGYVSGLQAANRRGL